MDNNTQLGQKGEQLAVDYLMSKGYVIRERNYRYKRAEIDIIMEKEEFLVFVEVKMRSGKSFGNPEEFVDDKKIEFIQMAAENYLEEVDWKGNIRFDIISIIKKSIPEVDHFEDAF